MADEVESENEHHYAKQTWIWILMVIILMVAVIAVIALVLPFLYSPSYPNGYVIYDIPTQISNGQVVPVNNVPAYNRNMYIFQSPSSGSAPLLTGSLSFAGVKQGMQLLVSNTTPYPLEVTAGTTSASSSYGTSVATINTQQQYNKCIPSTGPAGGGGIGSYVFFGTKTTIPANATFFFVAPSDNNLNLVQSTPIDVTYSGTLNATVCS